jgi:uncharacterized membrane protein
MSDTEAGAVEEAASKTSDQVEPENPHAQSVLKLASAMLKATLIVGSATAVLGMIVFTVIYGVHGLLGALVGGVIAMLSSLATIGVMRFCAAMDPMMVMAIVLGSYVFKVLVLLGLMTLAKHISFIQPYAFALTMLAAFIFAAGGEMRAFQKTKIPTIIPASK